VRRPHGPPLPGLRSPYRPEAYDQSRPLYPGSLFDPLRAGLGRALPGPITLADLGCGTGLAWLSFRAWAPDLPVELLLVEPNEELLSAAGAKARSWAPPHRLREIPTTAERIDARDESLDLVLVGSAWHWFQPTAVTEVVRLLKPGGQLFVFEYQFPKLALDPLGLNEWIRRQFNEVWRFDDQVPRGTLQEKAAALRSHTQLSLSRSTGFDQTQEHSAAFFTELLFTQARYLHHEQKTEKQKALDGRSEIFEQVEQRLESPGNSAFRYRFDGLVFQKRRV
jgi:ubiquinone/menaquinone biosynthesis C-methylase UbiE